LVENLQEVPGFSHEIPQKLLVAEKKRNWERNHRDVRSKSKESSRRGEGEIACRKCSRWWKYVKIEN